jgi:hypothetical protein
VIHGPAVYTSRMENYSLTTKCKKPGSTAIISLDNVEGFSLSGGTLNYQGPPIHHHCEACGGIHSYSLKDVQLRQRSAPHES